MPGVSEAPTQTRTEAARDGAEPEPEGSVLTPGVSPHREAQPQVEEDVELPTVQFDAEESQFDAESPLLPMEAEHVPVPEDNDVLTLQAKAKEGKGAKRLCKWM